MDSELVDFMSEGLGRDEGGQFPSLHILHLSQDDPKKCTARALGTRNMAVLHESVKSLPHRGILLDPLCGKVLGPEDRQTSLKRGALVGFDASWKQLEESLRVLQSIRGGLQRRALPLLLAGNPVSWGQPGRMSTAEAMAASLYLLGQKERAHALLTPFRWGERFFELNYEPLEAYCGAASSEELINLQFEYFD